MRELENSLPPGIASSTSIRRGRAFLFCARYGSASDNAPFRTAGWDFEFSGLIHSEKKAELVAEITGRHLDGGVALTAYPTQFCAIGIQKDQIVGFVSAPGTDQLFSYEDDDFVVVTNRHNLIALFLTEERARVRRDALILTLVQDHIRDFGMSMEGIRRAEPSTVIRLTIDGVHHGRAAPKNWETAIDARDLVERIEALSKDYSEMLGGFERIELGISGGKDSRAILGLLLSGDIQRDRLRLSTGGEPFAPDVMSAQDVVEIAGLSGQHKASTPTLFSKEVFGDMLSMDLWVDSAGTSLADLRQMPNRNLGSGGLRVGGHEIGFKQQPNELDLEPYLQSRVRPWLAHPLVKKGTCDHLAESFVSRTREFLQHAPKRRYNAIDLAMNHITLHTSSTQTVSHLGNFEVHPMLDPRFLELLVGTSNELVAAQFIHYAMMHQAKEPLEVPAYANDEWPKGLAELAAAAAIPFRGTPKPAYRFLEFFPSQTGFGRHNWRFRMYAMYTPWMKEYIHDEKSRLDFLELKNIDELLSRDHKDWNFRDIYRIGCLLKICLTDYFGVRAWHLSNRGSIEAEINSLARTEGVAGIGGKAPSREEILARTERALAESIRLMRAAEERAVDCLPAEDVEIAQAKGQTPAVTPLVATAAAADDKPLQRSAPLRVISALKKTVSAAKKDKKVSGE